MLSIDPSHILSIVQYSMVYLLTDGLTRHVQWFIYCRDIQKDGLT